jgi:hypothetical protein
LFQRVYLISIADQTSHVRERSSYIPNFGSSIPGLDAAFAGGEEYDVVDVTLQLHEGEVEKMGS